MSHLDNLAPLTYGLLPYAIGAVQQLDLVVAKVGATPIPTGNGRQAGKIIVANTDEFMGSPEGSETALDSDYPMMEGKTDTTVSYSLKEHKRARLVLDRHEKWNQGKGPLKSAAAAQVGRFLGLKMESNLATVLFTTGNWTNAAVADLGGGGVQWSTYSTAVCDLDLDIMLQRHREKANCEATDIVMGQQVFDAYRRCLSTQGLRVVTSGAGQAEMLTAEEAKSRIEARHNVRLHVGSARHNTAAPGLTKVGAYIWGKSVWVGNLSPTPGELSDAGVILERRAVAVVVDNQETTGLDFGGATLPINITATMQEPPKARGTVIAGEAYWDIVITDSSLGQLYTAAVA
jgi:hypothetical protein